MEYFESKGLTDETILQNGQYAGQKCKDIPKLYWLKLYETTPFETVKRYVESRIPLLSQAQNKRELLRAN